ncbi:hypothetical protein GGR21_001590 [Dysgonomonas hofstadii]|uniref:LVIVD repeat-containing protein n=1 Tax=Dysgonomonas hofstadii TaxID=637886 RepID=A0A840CS00_9BACT|nr:hypothetical protein [Dysgonomonas hofstadii]MBB4035695.1 hypothetical protein [Dysgonomonas hofstadii]
MKTKLRNLLFCIILIGTFFINTSYTPSVYDYVPIFMERSELEKSVFYQDKGRELVSPGKIYYKAPYIYINEQYKGVHVINNSNPEKPVNEGFIVTPGCIDMAIKGNILYVDNSVDLVAFDLNTKEVTERIKNVFPEPVPPHNLYYYINRPNGFILVGWKRAQ